MSQPLCLTPTQFGNFEVLRHQRDALCTTNKVLHRKRRLMHNDIALHRKTSYVLSHRMARKERTYPVTCIALGYDFLSRVPVSLAQSSQVIRRPRLKSINRGENWTTEIEFGILLQQVRQLLICRDLRVQFQIQRVEPSKPDRLVEALVSPALAGSIGGSFLLREDRLW
jgi:hypothetical protein